MDIDFISEEEAKNLAIEFPRLEQLDMEQFKQTVKKLHEDTFQNALIFDFGSHGHISDCHIEYHRNLCLEDVPSERYSG